MTPQPDGATHDRSASDRTSGAIVAVGGATALLAAVLLSPAGVESGPIVCPFRLLTGIECPACGMTRSWVHLAHGDLAASLANHPVGPALMLLTLIATVSAALFVVRGWWLVSPRVQLQTLALLGVATGIVGVARWIALA